MLRRLALGLVLLISVGCSDVIELDLTDGRQQIAIDAFLTDHDTLWRVEVNRSQDYFDSAQLTPVDDASVTLSDDAGNVYAFAYSIAQQAYTYDVLDTTGVYQDGRTYTLDIVADNVSYTATQQLNPVPAIDSVKYTYIDGFAGFPGGYFGEFYSMDLSGRKDFYWIRGFRNDSAFTSPNSITIAEDAAFGGEGADGFMFIPPVRQAVNEFGVPYQDGDSLRIELMAISEDTYNFILELRNQLSNASAGLFAVPPANVWCNFVPDNGDELGVVGWFSIGRKSVSGLTITEEGATSIPGF